MDVWSVYRSTANEESGEFMDPSVLPGWSYARALILRAKEKEKKERGEVSMFCWFSEYSSDFLVRISRKRVRKRFGKQFWHFRR